MSKLTSETLSIGELFSQKFFFRVPEYQRPFLWDDDNLTDLVDDLANAPRDREYYLGTLVLHEVQETEFDVVDGQQRLTALCILLACIRDCDVLSGQSALRGQIHEKVVQPAKILDGVPEKDRIQVRDQASFNVMVATMGGTANPSGPAAGNSINGRYELARSIFRSRLDVMSYDEVKELALFISQSCVVNYLATSNFDDAFRLFTIVNDRGKQLRRIDVLKALNLSPDVVTSNVSRGHYAHRWEEMEERLGEEDFEEIFHLIRLMYVQDKPQADLLKEFQDRILGKPSMPRAGKDFLDILEKYVDLYQTIFVDRDYLEGTVNHQRFRTLMAAMVSEFHASEWKSCLLYFADKYGPSEFWNYVLGIEKVYLEHWVGGVRKDERYATYTDLLAAIKATDNAGSVISAVAFDGEVIMDACTALNFYTLGFSKYLLLRAEILASELDQDRAFTVKSVEHVLPQNPAEGSEWSKRFTEEQIRQLVHTAGNLVLLSKGKNSSASNREFPQKKETYLKTRVSDFPRSLQVLDFDEWTPEIIETRTKVFASSILADP